MSLEIKIVNKIEKLPRQDWDKVFPKAAESYNFFRAIDISSFSDQFKFFYILVYSEGAPVAATSCFVMDFQVDMTVKGWLKKFLGLIKKIFPRMLNFRTLVCGLPMGQGRIGVRGSPELAIEKISATLEKIAKEEKTTLIIYKDFVGSYQDKLSSLLKNGYIKIESLPSTDMKIDFSSFEEYLKRLSPSSRENLKRNFKKVDNRVKIDLEVKNSLENNEVAGIYDLYLQTYNKQDMGLEKLPADFFVNISRCMPEETRFFIWKIGGRPVAFALCLVSEDYFVDYYLGFDYSVAHQYFLYFVRFRDLINWCIEHKIKHYEMGVTTYEPKRRLGFNFIRLYFYIKHRNRLINKFTGLIGHFIKPENFDKVFESMDTSG